MKLLTKANRKALPMIYSQEHIEDPLVQVKFFSPYSGWEWYAIEFDGEDTFFGLVKGFEIELGYFSLQELSSLTAMNGMLPLVERDMYFKPIKLSELRKQLERAM